MCGRPSATLLTRVNFKPAASKATAVPRVANNSKPESNNFLAMATIFVLSASLTDKNTLPEVGNLTPAANCDFTKASVKVLPTPITSPVDFISGPRIVSTPGNFTNGKTASFTEKYSGMNSLLIPCSARVFPAIQRAAIFAKALPVALDTNGTVLDARGLTSSWRR